MQRQIPPGRAFSCAAPTLAPILAALGVTWTTQSCLIQDEPEAGSCFSHKMSLKRRFRMLGIDHQHGRRRETEPGADPGLGGGQRRGAIPVPGPGGVVRVGEPYIEPAGLRPAETRWQRTGATLHCQDDRIKPGPGSTLDSVLPGRRPSEPGTLARHSIFERSTPGD